MTAYGQCFYAACSTRPGHRLARHALRCLRKLGLLRRFHPAFESLELDHDATAELMRLWSRVHWSAGDGMMPAEQLLAIYRLAATWPVDGDVVELGAWVGLTTSYLAAACRARRDGKVYAVDTFAGTKEGGEVYSSIERFEGSTFSAFRERIERAGVDDLVEPLIGYTDQMVKHYQGRPIRFLLIDADHSYEGVKRDFELWSPLVAPGGLIVFHDYLMPEVARFVDEQVADDGGFTPTPGLVVENVMAVRKRTARSYSRAEVVLPSVRPQSPPVETSVP